MSSRHPKNENEINYEKIRAITSKTSQLNSSKAFKPNTWKLLETIWYVGIIQCEFKKLYNNILF